MSYDESEVQTKTHRRPSTKSKQQQKPDLSTPQPSLQRSYSHKPLRYSSYVPSAERDFFHQPIRHNSFRYSQDQEPPKASSLRDSDDRPGYQSAYVNYQTPSEHSLFMNEDTFGYPFMNQDTFGYPELGEPSTFKNQDACHTPTDGGNIGA